MRYAYGITAALLLGGTALTLSTGVGAQVAQNEPGSMTAVTAPRPGAPLSFADLAARLQPAVVNISTESRVPIARTRNPMEEMLRQFGAPVAPRGDEAPGATRRTGGLGSGFIISPDGYVVTNNHLVQGATGTGTVDEVTVILADRKEYKARIVGRDPATDLALLKVDATGLPFVRFGDSDRTRVGDWVVAIGNPLGLGGTVTAGIVSAIGRNIGATQYDRFIQTDAAINRGNSGGPMFDLQGNVIGINTALYSETGGNIGIGFAIPASQASGVIDQLRRGQRVQRGYLGVGIQPLDEALAESFGLPKNRGELIGSVQPGEGAARAGIQQGDVVVKIAGRDVTPDENLSYIVSQQPIGARIPVELIRNGQRRTVTAVVGQRPTDEEIARRSGVATEELPAEDSVVAPSRGQATTRDSLGLSVVTLTPQIAQGLRIPTSVRGVVISSVGASSDAAQRGVQRGDVILSINGRPTLTPEAAAAVVEEARRAGRGAVRLFVQRGAAPPQYVGVELAQR